MAGQRPPPPKVRGPAEPQAEPATDAIELVDGIEWLDDAVARDFSTSPPGSEAAPKGEPAESADALGESQPVVIAAPPASESTTSTGSSDPGVALTSSPPPPAVPTNEAAAAGAAAAAPIATRNPPARSSGPSGAQTHDSRPPTSEPRTRLWLGGAAAVAAIALIWRCGAADPRAGDARRGASTVAAGERGATLDEKLDATPAAAEGTAQAAALNGDGAATNGESPAGRGAGGKAGADSAGATNNAPPADTSANDAQPADDAQAADTAPNDAQPAGAAPTDAQAADAAPTDDDPTVEGARTDTIASADARGANAQPIAGEPDNGPGSSGRTTPIGTSAAPRTDNTRKLSAEELLELARKAWNAGNARDTFKYANQSRYKEPSGEATELSTLAACKMRQPDAARASFDELDGDRRRRVRSACRDMGVRVGL